VIGPLSPTYNTSGPPSSEGAENSFHRWAFLTGPHRRLARSHDAGKPSPMIAPAWLLHSLTVLMLAVAAASAARIATRLLPATGRLAAAPTGSLVLLGAVEVETELAQLLIAVTMVGTLVPRMSVLPGFCWEAIFLSFTAWFGWQWMRDAYANGLRRPVGGHGGARVFHRAVTTYMFAVPASSADMSAICRGNATEVAAEFARPWPNLTLLSIFAVVLFGFCLRDLLNHRDTSGDKAQAAASHIAMGGTMALMLLIMN
jgi:hypothetical protein